MHGHMNVEYFVMHTYVVLYYITELNSEFGRNSWYMSSVDST